MDSPKQSVLVLDGDMVAALTIARSLARRGVRVDMASHLAGVIASYSRAVSGFYCYPDPLSLEDAFLSWLEEHLAIRHYDLVIPVTERTLVPVSQHRARFSGATIAMAAPDSLEIVLDKARTIALAEELDIRVPVSVTISTLTELEVVDGRFQYPVVIKPARSVGSAGPTRAQLKVEYAFNREQLTTKVRHALHFGPVILQEYVKGDGVGVEILAREGDILYAFQHQRLHEVPLTGGGSSLRKSVAVEPALLDATRRLIAALKWHGVAMVEFKCDRESGDHWLMEINGRFWGSLPLAVAAGADFPAMLFDLLVGDKTDFPQGYREGIHCRRLTSDMHWYELALRRAAPPELDVVPSRWQLVKDLLLVFSPGHRFDVQSLRDIKPGVVEVWQLIASYGERLKGIMADRWFYHCQARAWRSGKVYSKLSIANSVLFLCYGNINRSALAEVYSRQSCLDAHFELHSAGLHPESGRPADPAMVKVAQAAGIPLQDFSSTVLTGDLVAGASLILAMDKSHYDRVVELYPDAASRTFLLGGADGSSGRAMAIADPYGRSEQDYQRCFNRVCQCIEGLGGLLESSVKIDRESV